MVCAGIAGIQNCGTFCQTHFHGKRCRNSKDCGSTLQDGTLRCGHQSEALLVGEKRCECRHVFKCRCGTFVVFFLTRTVCIACFLFLKSPLKNHFPLPKIITSLSLSGDIVGLFTDGRPLTERPGIVTRSNNTSISVAFDEFPDTVDLRRHAGSLQVVKLANDVTYRRIKR